MTESKRSERDWDRARREAYEQALVPFRDVFGRLRTVELAPLAPSRTGPRRARDTPAAEWGIAAAKVAAFFAVGAVIAAAAEPATFKTVKAFATASTGRRTNTLTGIAAYNAVIAAMGGGARSAGGGGMEKGAALMAAIKRAAETAGSHVAHEGASRTTLATHRGVRAARNASRARLRALEQALGRLTEAMTARTPELASAVERSPHWSDHTAGSRLLALESFFLAVAIARVMAARADERTGDRPEEPDSTRLVAEVDEALALLDSGAYTALAGMTPAEFDAWMAGEDGTAPLLRLDPNG
ncbi:hypothetical protein ACN20G_02335 [Streptomyces sp. BI20]|uniref:hypothetical protein n=1 Tax=Streptomyces sp. BI20 TaxID=3403460 RepID=UPI003C725D97